MTCSTRACTPSSSSSIQVVAFLGYQRAAYDPSQLICGQVVFVNIPRWKRRVIRIGVEQAQRKYDLAAVVAGVQALDVTDSAGNRLRQVDFTGTGVAVSQVYIATRTEQQGIAYIRLHFVTHIVARDRAFDESHRDLDDTGIDAVAGGFTRLAAAYNQGKGAQGQREKPAMHAFGPVFRRLLIARLYICCRFHLPYLYIPVKRAVSLGFKCISTPCLYLPFSDQMQFFPYERYTEVLVTLVNYGSGFLIG
jgi:hypothetical protein